ncbi:hypothetical protein F5876DRAFT_70738 [Lentinula aff. lateritia]|uniref:Uncharacterized protein n=1 Tax=Lentinula aff. lateritia TaxID=2804960 RepID=A0ACC1THV5_9AGAR|nr:hypothetical protein F5876DRAFT_70738 [Lentinula aff. lateritia]
MYGSTNTFPYTSKKAAPVPGKCSMLMRELSDDEDDASASVSTSNGSPWMDEFSKYYDAKDIVPEGMSIVQWWGMNAQHLPIWASLARDCQGDIVEALQFLKCILRRDLLFRESFTTADELELESEENIEGLAAQVDWGTLVTENSQWILLDDGNEDWEDVIL